MADASKIKKISNWAKNPYKIKSLNKKVKCKCPQCGKDHIKVMYWSGKLPARKNCDSCIQKNGVEFDEYIKIK